MYNAYQEKLNEPENWIERSDLRTFVRLDEYVKKFNDYIQELESLDNSYEFMQGTTETNMTFHKVRVYNYINEKELNKRREKRRKGA